MAALREKKILLFKFLAMLSGPSPTPLATPSSAPLSSGSYLHSIRPQGPPSPLPPSPSRPVMGFWTSGVLLKVEPQWLMCDPDTRYEHNGSALVEGAGGGSCSKRDGCRISRNVLWPLRLVIIFFLIMSTM